MSFELPLQLIVLRIIGLLVVGMVHALALVGAVTAMGDRGPRFEGRLTPNPLVHADPLGIVAAIFTMGGWIRPVDIDPAHLRHGRLALVGAVLFSLAVPVVLFLLLLQLRGLFVVYLPPSYSNVANLSLRVFAEMSVIFALVNLVPIPPLTGGHLLQAVAPRPYEVLRARSTIIAIGLVALAILDRGAVIRRLLDPVIATLTGA